MKYLYMIYLVIILSMGFAVYKSVKPLIDKVNTIQVD